MAEAVAAGTVGVVTEEVVEAVMVVVARDLETAGTRVAAGRAAAKLVKEVETEAETVGGVEEVVASEARCPGLLAGSLEEEGSEAVVKETVGREVVVVAVEAMAVVYQARAAAALVVAVSAAVALVEVASAVVALAAVALVAVAVVRVN